MATFRDIVDGISGSVRSDNKDQRIPKRHILSVFRSNLEFLISQKLNDKSLFREDGLYTTVECFPMECTDTNSCDIPQFKSCNKVSKGLRKIPGIVNSRFGPAVRSVTNADGTKAYRFNTPNDYRRSKKRAVRSGDQAYYIKDGVPYLPDACIKKINLEVLTLEPYLTQELSECGPKSCKSYWDYEIPTSDKITNIARQQTINEIMGTRQVPKDDNPNLSENSKGPSV